MESYDGSPHRPAHQQIRAGDQPYAQVPVSREKRDVIATIRAERPGWSVQHVQHFIAHARQIYQTELTRDEVLSVLNS